jgi:GNAT superfamily N-acetyltransferase
MNEVKYREICFTDKETVNKLITERWGGEFIVVHKTIYIPEKLNGFIALIDGKTAGLITYIIENSKCEIVSLDSILENKGIGTRLIELAVETAKKNGCNSIWLITTNDNLRAISFYEKRGFELVQIFPNAVDESRKIKPQIPLIAENGIPINDELKFVMVLEN